jgi:hypothetical protein
MPSKAKSVTLTNPKGTTRSPGSPITLGAIEVSGIDFSFASGFAKTNTICSFGLSLSPGGSCSVPLSFQATNAGVLSGTLQIEHNGTNSPIIVNLQGKGVLGKLGFAPHSVTFPKTPVGTQSAKQRTVTLTNNNGVPISLVKISLDGFNPDDFSETTTCSKTLSNKSKCSITVTFSPSTTGQRTAILNISAGATPNPIAVKLSGSGG